MKSTPVSLLDQLGRQPDEPAAWDRFVFLYTPLLRHWSNRLGLHGADVEDLVQDVFLVLVRKLPEFRYDPRQSFRSWLWKVHWNKYREHRKRRDRQSVEVLSLDDKDQAAPEEPDWIETEYRHNVFQQAVHLMRQDFQPPTWQAFWETAVGGRPAGEVARELGLGLASVYAAKSRVLRRLRTELDGLLD